MKKNENSRLKPSVALVTAHGWVGVSTPVVTTALYLAKKGYAVDLFLTENKHCSELGIFLPQLKDENIHLHTYRCSVPENEIIKLPNGLKIPHTDLEFVNNFQNKFSRYDWIIGFDPQGLNRAGLLGLRWKIPFLYHSLELLDNNGGQKDTESWFAQKALFVLTQDKARAKILSSMNQIPEEKIHLIYNSAFGDILTTRQNYFHNKFDINRDKRIVLAVGSLLPAHCIDSIVESVAGWPDEFDLILHGWIPDVDYKSKLLQLIESQKSRIFLSTDVLAPQEKEILFQSTDIGLVFFDPIDVNYKYAAGSSGKLYDFMRCGVPVIGNDIPGMRELVENNDIGKVVKNAGELHEILPKIDQNKEFHKKSCFNSFPKYEFGRSYDELLKCISFEINSIKNPTLQPQTRNGLPVEKMHGKLKAGKLANPSTRIDPSVKKDDIFIASYPRSGNTWTRNLLTDIILQLHNIRTDTNKFDDVEKVIPDIHLNKIHEIDPLINLPFRLIKSHEEFSAKVRKNIYIFRFPADALCSYYHYTLNFEKKANYRNIDNFCLDKVKDYCSHLNSFLNAHNNKTGDILFISYEWLHRDTVGALLVMAEFLGLSVDRQMCERAVENQKFDKHQKQSKQFYRKGIVGSGQQELKAETIDHIEGTGGELYHKAESLQKTIQHGIRNDNGADRKLKIVHLCTNDFGGAGKAAARINNGLRQIGVESTLLVLNKKSDDPNIKVITSGVSNVLNKHSDTATTDTAVYARQLKRWKTLYDKYPNRPKGLEIFTDDFSEVRLYSDPEIQKADIINLHWVAGMMDYATAPTSFRGKTVVWTLHDMNPFTGGCHYSGDCQKYQSTCHACPQLGSDKDEDLSAYIWRQKFKTYKNLQLNIICPSHWLELTAKQSSLLASYPTQVIANGIPLDIYKPHLRENIRQRLNLPPTAKVILFGADSVTNQRKGITYLVGAIKCLSLKGSEKPIIVTFGDVTEQLALPKDIQVVHLGSIANERRLAQIFSVADLFVIPSLEDNLPNTVVEALACGVPVVGFNVGGISEMIDHLKTGYLANPQDINSLAKGIEWAITAGQDGLNFSDVCRDTARKKYALENQAQQYLKLYNTVIDQNRSKTEIQIETTDLPINTIGKDDQDIFVSAIISAFNSERFMHGRLDNLVKQTLYNKGRLEIIIVDSNSSQTEKKIVDDFASHYQNIEYIYTSKTETVYGAWNRGIRYARGKYIINANTDDRFALDALERMADELDAGDDIHAVYGDWLVTEVENDSFDSHTAKIPFSYPEFFPPLFLYYQITSHACLLRKNIFSQIGLFDPRLKVFGDREFMLRFSKAGLKARKIPFDVGLYLNNQKGLEHSYPGAGAEYSSIRDLYFQPRLIASLFGYETALNDKKLAGLYAVTGSFGKDFYALNNQSISDFNFAARLFVMALELDQFNEIALNNLGIIMCQKGKPEEGLLQFKKAIECKGAEVKGKIRENLQAAKRGATSPENYWWYPCAAADATVYAKRNNNSTDLRWPPNSDRLNKMAVQELEHNSPLVSVIVPSYNRPEMLRVALDSLTAQTLKDFEVIVINDGGVNIDYIIDGFRKCLNIQFIDYPVNRNRAAARNNGLKIADGKYIAYLDDDDRLYPEHLEILVNFLESNDCQMAYSDAYRAVEEKRQENYVVVKRDLPHSTEFNKDLLLVRNFIPSLCVMHQKSCLDSVGRFDESLGTHEDWDLWIKISRQFTVAHVNKITGEYSWRSDGTSTTSSRRDDFLQTMKTVYDKHKKFAVGNPRLIEMQTNSLENLEKEISAAHNEVECSIIIPVFNKLNFTKRCIESLINNTSGMRVEVLVVDNNSTDGTKEFLTGRQDKLTIITNSSNTGFAKACNQGAMAAKGRYLVFLNNDTEVQSGWLDELVKCCRQNDRIGVVGAKLLYADNTIQHAGVAIKNSPHPIFPFHIHRGKPADSPEVNVVQEYQAVTGACMLVRRKLFEQIGGFDEEFINGYEDIDLCFRIREAGYKVVYCPTSVAYHYESVSSGRFAQANHNIKRLHQKWQNKVLPDEDTRLVANKAKLPSIIILTHNQIAYTRKCLDSIFRHTSEPFELIVVDNGSMDGTPEYLEAEVVGRWSKVPVNVIKNNDNLGFSAGNNQGIAAARGDYIILLNNDVVVTQGWLERLIGCADSNPGTAIVGPRTNSIAGPQKMDPVSYDQKSLKGLDDYAAVVAEKFKGHSTYCWRVVGFCMLIKRGVINKIGGLDTRFGLGNFEDDDFCLRAQLAGFKARIAEDSFVHHFGGQTFKASDIDYRDSLNKNWEIFKEKWDIPKNIALGSTYTVIPPRNGFNHAKHFFPLPVSGSTTESSGAIISSANIPAISAHIEIINNNAEKDNQLKIQNNFRQGGNAVKPYEEIYRSIQPLLDGSNPENAIAALSNLVKSFPDFAQAHNDLGVLYHQGDQNEKAVHHYEQAAQLEPDNGTFKKNLADFYYAVLGRVEDALIVYEDVLAISPQDVETRQICGHICVALHQFDKAQAFYSRVLEIEPWQAEIREILDKLQAHGSESANDKSPDEIYQTIQSDMEGADLGTTIEALENLATAAPDFAPAHNDLGVLYYQRNEKEKALTHYEQAARLEPGNVTFKKNLADFYYVEQGRVEDALKIYVDLLAINPEDVETLQVCGHICVALEKFEDARVFYNRVLEIEPWHAEARQILDQLNNPGQESKEAKAPEEIYQGIQSEMAGNDPRMATEALEKLAAAAPDFAPAHNDLGVLYYQSGEKDKAIDHYEQAARLDPGNVTFKKNLADFYYVEQGRVEDALNIYVDLLAINPQDIETLQITGHICVALHKFEDAKVFYNRVLEIEPWNAETRDFLEKLQLKEKAV